MKDIDKIFSFIICFLIICVILVTAILPKSVLAEETDNRTYCSLCHKSKDDPLYKKEKQFYDKIHTIKKVFGDSIDEVVLAATVLHRYDDDTLYVTEYDENYDSDKYSDAWKSFKTTQSSDIQLTQEQQDQLDNKKVEANEKMDLLTTATIVMLDSDKFGKYSDDNYKKALAGDKLVGNMGDSDSIFNKFFNSFVCGIVQTFTIITSPFDYISSFFNGDGFWVTTQTVSNRLVNTQSVCNHGFVGGLYLYKGYSEDQIANDTRSKDQIQAAKNSYAQQIIDLANYYKKHYSKYNDSANTCANNTAGATGDYANWKQADSTWGDIHLGSSSVTVRQAGCLVTSLSMQIARSGTQLGTLPSGYTEFNPGAFVTSLDSHSDSFVSVEGSPADIFNWSGFSDIAPNWRTSEFTHLKTTDNATVADAISKELSEPYDGKYQKFILLNIKHPGEHWVAVTGVENGVVQIMDPGAPTGTTLDDNYSSWTVLGYKVMYATDVMFNQTGTSTGGTSTNNCAGSMSDLVDVLAYFEGTTTCNYRGQGEGTGYAVENLHDGAGLTTALGITSNNDQAEAAQVGYTDYLADSENGCTNKEYIDKMLPLVINKFTDYVDENYSDLNLNSSERMVMTSLAYGGFGCADAVADTIRTYGKDSEKVFDCFRLAGCSYSDGKYNYGLSIRRLAEYELFMTGNVNAAKPYSHFRSYSAVAAASLSDVKALWPSNRNS